MGLTGSLEACEGTLVRDHGHALTFSWDLGLRVSPKVCPAPGPRLLAHKGDSRPQSSLLLSQSWGPLAQGPWPPEPQHHPPEMEPRGPSLSGPALLPVSLPPCLPPPRCSHPCLPPPSLFFLLPSPPPGPAPLASRPFLAQPQSFPSCTSPTCFPRLRNLPPVSLPAAPPSLRAQLRHPFRREAVPVARSLTTSKRLQRPGHHL